MGNKCTAFTQWLRFLWTGVREDEEDSTDEIATYLDVTISDGTLSSSSSDLVMVTPTTTQLDVLPE